MEDRQRHQAPASQTDGGVGNSGIDKRRQLLAYALKLLAIRPRSCAEIASYFRKKTSDQEMIDGLINELKAEKFLDDLKFAIWVIESYSRVRPKGKSLLARILDQKGVSKETIESALAEMGDSVELALKVLKKKTVIWKHLSPREYRFKAGRLLYSRGFTWDVIERALKKGYNDNNVNSDTYK